MLNGRPFVLKLLQPEESLAFAGAGDAGPHGGGWRGVYKWCCQVIERSGTLRSDPLFYGYDLLLLHLDADVADEDPAKYQANPMAQLSGILPCAKTCPPASDTTDSLRRVMLSWVGEIQTPPKAVLCTPSKNLEAWVMAIFFPNDTLMQRQCWECFPNPESRLGQQPKKSRFPKKLQSYEQRSSQIQAKWTLAVTKCSEAERFQNEFLAALPP